MPLTLGNSKLGVLIHQWSIPAALAHICVGATALCIKLCYATRNHFRRTGVKNALAANFQSLLRRNFVSHTVAWIRANYVRNVRIHVSGDFHAASAVRKWQQIAKRNPNVRFFAYTRSWRKPAILAELRQFAQLPNVSLWFSCDRETGIPPRTRNVRRAYLMQTDDDRPRYNVDLFFRNNANTVLKWVDGTLVCPSENGVTTTTCSQCRLCLIKRAMPRQRQPVIEEINA